MTARESRLAGPLAEVLLVSLSLVSIFGCYRLFADWSFFWRLTACAVVAHGLAFACRRLGLTTGAAAAISLVGLAVTVGVVLYPSSTFAGLPTPDVLGSIRDDLGRTVQTFNAVRAPAPVSLPLLLPSALFVWWAAFVADWAAFRLRFSFEALVPLASVFVFSSLIGVREAQVPLTAVLVALALGFVLAQRVIAQQANAGWVGREGSDGPSSLLRTGAGLIAGAAVLAAILGPLLPGARSASVYELRPGPGSSGSSRTVTSPLVEIRKRLLDQTDLELFTVKASARAYWRLTALDEFDGNLWSSNGSYDNIDGSLPSGDGHGGTSIEQQYSIKALQSPWLPAAFEARTVSSTARITWSRDLSTLIIAGQALTADGTDYSVTSEQPDLTPAALEAANGSIPAKVRETDLPLPAGISPLAVTEAVRATAGLTTAYDKALALQQYFRDGFTYDLAVDTDNSNDAMTAFLQSKRGYCQQFAGTYAAMARYLGLPARVAVGFTPGEPSAADPTLFHVKGLHAHAWPEVYFAGVGWVPFEPTPGRGIPGASSYTNVTEEQASPAGGGTTETVPATTAPPTTAAAATQETTPTTTPEATPKPPEHHKDWWNTWGGRTELVLGALILLVGAYVLLVPALHRHRRQARRAAATTPDDQVAVAWAEGIDAVALIGLAPARSETPAEFATRADPAVGGQPWARLAELQVTAAFAERGVGEHEAAEAYGLAEEIDERVRSQITPRDRWRADLDPRPHRRPRTPRNGRTKLDRATAKLEITELTR